jgi:hypothetical protein
LDVNHSLSPLRCTNLVFSFDHFVENHG